MIRGSIKSVYHRYGHWIRGRVVKRVASAVFFVAVVTLIIVKGRQLEWSKVFESFRETPTSSLLLGVGLGILCYSAYAAYDLIGRHVFKVRVNRFGAWAAAWISFACNLNLGALVGSVAFRYRLYSRLGVSAGEVTRILGLSVVSNWLGYCLLAGVLFLSGAVTLPGSWAVGVVGLRLIGAGLVAVVVIYLYLCVFSDRTEITVRNRTIYLPSLRVVLLQFAISITHWSLMAAVVYQFMPSDISYFNVYAVLLISGIAGAVSHIPGGLGVLEAVFVALLSGQAAQHQLVAALFAYRCVFYLVPLAVAIPAYLVLEGMSKKLTAAAET